jgi:hypothetical protein
MCVGLSVAVSRSLLHGCYIVGTPTDHPGVNFARSEAPQTVQDQA